MVSTSAVDPLDVLAGMDVADAAGLPVEAIANGDSELDDSHNSSSDAGGLSSPKEELLDENFLAGVASRESLSTK